MTDSTTPPPSTPTVCSCACARACVFSPAYPTSFRASYTPREADLLSPGFLESVTGVKYKQQQQNSAFPGLEHTQNPGKEAAVWPQVRGGTSLTYARDSLQGSHRPSVP